MPTSTPPMFKVFEGNKRVEGKIRRHTPTTERDVINTIDDMALLQQRGRDTTTIEQKPVTNDIEGKTAGRRRKLSPKNQNQKAIEVFVDDRIHVGIKALSIILNMNAKDYVENLLIRDIDEKDQFVKEGIKYLEQADGNVARAKYLFHNVHNENLSHVERLKRELAASHSQQR